MLQPSRAPGSSGDAAPPAPAETQPSTGAPADAPPAGGQQSMLFMALPIVLLVGFLFLTQRGEKKRREKIESELKKGDRVLTRAGLVGKVNDISGQTVRLEIAPGVVVTMLVSAIEGPAEVDQVKGKPAKGEPAKAGAGKKK